MNLAALQHIQASLLYQQHVRPPMHTILVCIQDMLQAENASQKYIQQMFRRQQPQPPAEQPSSQPKGMYLMLADVACIAVPLIFNAWFGYSVEARSLQHQEVKCYINTHGL